MSLTLLAPPRRLSAQFAELKDRWQRETEHLSSPSDIALHPAYQRIIGMGPQVLPHILGDLKRQPRQWFWALKAITGEDPVPEADRGRVVAMARAWVSWGEVNGWGDGD
jgi:hypothetical protein